MTSTEQIAVRVFGGPTALFSYGGLTFLTDPTFDAPGDYPRPGRGPLTKTTPASATPADLGPIDVVLLSHDEHPDNLDNAGRALLADVPLTLTTPGGAQRLGDRATAILFAGAPRIPALFGGRPIVLDSAQAAEAAKILGVRRVVPVHYDSWSHFTEGRAELVAAFTAAGLANRLDQV